MTAASGRRDGARAVVPVEATQAMADALVGEPLPITEWSFQADYARMIAASPSAGSISAEDLERAARARWDHRNIREDSGWSWDDMNPSMKAGMIADQRAAFEAAGLPVEKEPS